MHSVEIELESVRVQLEEEAEARLDLERQLSKANQDCLSWKSKYDHACTSHTEEIEELRYVLFLRILQYLSMQKVMLVPVIFRRKFHIRVTELEEQISALISKCSGLEKIKSRLQSEVEILIIDLEKVIKREKKNKKKKTE